MLKIILLLLISVANIIASPTISQNDKKAIHLLFKNKAPFLSYSEKLNILNTLNLSLSNDKKKLVIRDDDIIFDNIDPRVTIDDLNKDGIPEIAIYYGNSIYSGMVGQTLVIFNKNQNGEYIKILDLGSVDYEKLKSSSHGFSNLQLGGPGFCRGIWSFDGQQYSHFCNIEDIKGGCDLIGRKCTELQLKQLF